MLDSNGNLKDINGNTIVDDFRGHLTPGFPGFSLAPQYSLGYTADMLEAGVPVTYSYIITPHRPLPANPYGYGHPEDTVDYGPGQANYVDQLKQYDDAFGKFFARLQSDGITPANTLFVISSDENDHVIAATPTNASTCDGVTTPCTYGTTPGNTVGELAVNFNGLLNAEKGIATPASVTNDDAPDIYLTNNPAPNDPTLRAFEQATAGLTVTNPISVRAGLPATDTLTQYMANPVEQQLLHMQTFDPLRTPSFTAFDDPDYYVEGATTGGVPTCTPSGTPATSCVAQQPGFAWNHGDVQSDITTTWLGLVGPGVANKGVDATTWADHTDIRPTILYLTGLRDDKTADGRVLVEELTNGVLPDFLRTGTEGREHYVWLAQLYKQLNAPVNTFGLATLKISTRAMASTSPNDAYFINTEQALAAIGAYRDLLAGQILQVLNRALTSRGDGDGEEARTAAATLGVQSQALGLRARILNLRLQALLAQSEAGAS